MDPVLLQNMASLNPSLLLFSYSVACHAATAHAIYLSILVLLVMFGILVDSRCPSFPSLRLFIVLRFFLYWTNSSNTYPLQQRNLGAQEYTTVSTKTAGMTTTWISIRGRGQ